MEERILVKSKPVAFAKPLCISLAIIIFTIYCIQFIVQYNRFATCDKLVYHDHGYTNCGDVPNSEWDEYAEYNPDKCWRHYDYENGADFAMAKIKKSFKITGPISVGLVLITVLLIAWLKKMEMTVTDKRVYGCAAFGKRVDLPMDSISAFSSSWPKGISVASSSGRISFLMLQNRDKIYECVSNLMLERQTKAPVVVTEAAPSAPSASTADELKKYKELLDMGVITQEEFDAKKKQLLGL